VDNVRQSYANSAFRDQVTLLLQFPDERVRQRAIRSLYSYRSRRIDSSKLRKRIGELAGEKRRYGYRRIHVLLRREGWQINRKRTYRLYREAGLAVRRRKRKRIAFFERKPLPSRAR
jgi:transposase InsO family protein